MPDNTQPGVLPLRPLTTGEVLDAAVVLLRTRAGLLLGLGFAFALVEQAILFPLRRIADVDSSFLPSEAGLGFFGVVLLVGFATETFSIAMLGGYASMGAARALLGRAAPPRRRAPLLSLVVVALVAAVVSGAAAWSFLVLPVPLQWFGLVLAVILTGLVWPFAYGLFGLATPAVAIDELHPIAAVGRSLRLVLRNGMRALWIQVLGYVAWLLIRFGLSLAVTAIISYVYVSPSNTVDNLLLGSAWLVVNAIAYPMLGCLNAVLHLDTRVRTEGLDIALRRSLRRGVATENALRVPVSTA